MNNNIYTNIIGYELALPMDKDHFNKDYINSILNDKLSCIIETNSDIKKLIMDKSTTSKTCYYYSGSYRHDTRTDIHPNAVCRIVCSH